MSISVAQKIGLGLSANLLPDPGAGGTIRVGDAGISVCVLTVGSNSRIIADGGYAGQILVLVNNSGGTRTTIVDSATELNLSIDQDEVALCVYTGLSTQPWAAVLLSSDTVT